MVITKAALIGAGGGPAPGIPRLLQAYVQEIEERGIAVFACHNGYEPLIGGNLDGITRLTADGVRDWHLRGKVPIGMSRKTFSESNFDIGVRTLRALKAREGMDIVALVFAGGDDTLHTLSKFAGRLPAELAGADVFHLPKTIDDDYGPRRDTWVHPWPTYPKLRMRAPTTFGIATAAVHSARTSLLPAYEDLLTTPGNFAIEQTMGRYSGSLAYATSLVLGAMLAGLGEVDERPMCVIPEMIKADTTLQGLAEMCADGFKARWKRGKRCGMIIISEGVIPKLDPVSQSELVAHTLAQEDDHKNSDLEKFQLLAHLEPRVVDMLKASGIPVKKLRCSKQGYNLRCVPAGDFDTSYTTAIATHAVRRTADKGTTHARASLFYDGSVREVPFSKLILSADERTERIYLPREVADELWRDFVCF